MQEKQSKEYERGDEIKRERYMSLVICNENDWKHMKERMTEREWKRETCMYQLSEHREWYRINKMSLKPPWKNNFLLKPFLLLFEKLNYR